MDLVSHFIMARLLDWMAPSQVIGLFLAYNFAAFAVQPVVGHLLDRYGGAKKLGIAGLVLLLAAVSGAVAAASRSSVARRPG